MNHVGYATLADMQTFHFGSLYLQGTEVEKTLGKNWTGAPGRGKTGTASTTTSTSATKRAGANGGENWIRTDIGDYDSPGYDDLTMSLAFLPDIKTEAPGASGLPLFYRQNPTPPRATCPAPPPAIT